MTLQTELENLVHNTDVHTIWDILDSLRGDSDDQETREEWSDIKNDLSDYDVFDYFISTINDIYDLNTASMNEIKEMISAYE